MLALRDPGDSRQGVRRHTFELPGIDQVKLSVDSRTTLDTHLVKFPLLANFMITDSV